MSEFLHNMLIYSHFLLATMMTYNIHKYFFARFGYFHSNNKLMSFKPCTGIHPENTLFPVPAVRSGTPSSDPGVSNPTPCVGVQHCGHGGASLIRNRFLLGPYGRTMPRAYCGGALRHPSVRPGGIEPYTPTRNP